MEEKQDSVVSDTSKAGSEPLADLLHAQSVEEETEADISIRDSAPAFPKAFEADLVSPSCGEQPETSEYLSHSNMAVISVWSYGKCYPHDQHLKSYFSWRPGV